MYPFRTLLGTVDVPYLKARSTGLTPNHEPRKGLFYWPMALRSPGKWAKEVANSGSGVPANTLAA